MILTTFFTVKEQKGTASLVLIFLERVTVMGNVNIVCNKRRFQYDITLLISVIMNDKGTNYVIHILIL